MTGHSRFSMIKRLFLFVAFIPVSVLSGLAVAGETDFDSVRDMLRRRVHEMSIVRAIEKSEPFFITPIQEGQLRSLGATDRIISAINVKMEEAEKALVRIGQNNGDVLVAPITNTINNNPVVVVNTPPTVVYDESRHYYRTGRRRSSRYAHPYPYPYPPPEKPKPPQPSFNTIPPKNSSPSKGSFAQTLPDGSVVYSSPGSPPKTTPPTGKVGGTRSATPAAEAFQEMLPAGQLPAVSRQRQ